MIEKLKELIDSSVDEARVRQEVDECPKQHFKIIDGDTPLIRSNDCHSLDIVRNIKMEPVLKPVDIFYSTRKKYWEKNYKENFGKKY